MQHVSHTYNPYPDSQRVGVEVTFKLVDTAAENNATPSTNGANAISNLSQLTDENNRPTAKWATLEEGLWITDGTWSILPNDLGDTPIGWWGSALSGDDCTFAVNPTLTMELSTPASSIGYTMQFDDRAMQWASQVKITAYSGSTQLSQKTVSSGGPLLTVDMPVEGYDKVVFEIIKSNNPHRRVRLYSVLFGILQAFDARTIVKATWKAGCSASCESVQIREFTFTFDNSDQKYNFANPSGIYKYLQDGQVIRSAIIMDGERVDMGTHYYQRAEAQDESLTAEITSNDRFYWLDSDTYEAGESGTWTLSEALTAVLGSGVTVDASATIGARTVNKCIPTGTTKREAVRLLAQAARCTCWIDRAGVLIFRELSIGVPVDTLDEDNTDSMDGLKVDEKVDCVKLKVTDNFHYNSVDDRVEARTTEYTSGSGSNILTIDNPCAYSGQDVADWILAVRQRRLQYECKNRGNPAVEIGDTITIYNAFDESGNAAVYEYEMEFDGDLTETTKALGAAWT